MIIRHKFDWNEFPEITSRIYLGIIRHLLHDAAHNIIPKKIIQEIARELHKLYHR